MARIASRKLLLAAFATLALGTGLAAPAAEAHPWGGGFHHGFHHHGFGGFGGFGIGLGLGALAATAYAGSECYIERREFVDGYNRIYVRPVRVCD